MLLPSELPRTAVPSATTALRKYRSCLDGHAAKAQIGFRGIRQFDIC
jgi:hypothetical protein